MTSKTFLEPELGLLNASENLFCTAWISNTARLKGDGGTTRKYLYQKHCVSFLDVLDQEMVAKTIKVVIIVFILQTTIPVSSREDF